MSSYFNLTLDTTGPSGVTVKINGDDNKTTSTSAVLTVSCNEVDTSNCSMKIWGDINDYMGNPVSTEEDAVWQNYAETVNVVLTDCTEGESETKTVYVKVRDDVWNESVTASDTISLYVIVPAVTAVSNVSRISKIGTKSWGVFTFMVDRPCEDVKVMVVNSVNASVNDPSNSEIMMNSDGTDIPIGRDIMAKSNGLLDAGTEYGGIISGKYLEMASEGDGVKLIKLFAKGQTGAWSV